MSVLSSYATVADLLQALVALGYRKAPTIEPTTYRCPPGGSRPVTVAGDELPDGTLIHAPAEKTDAPYWRSSTAAAYTCCGARFIDIYPALGDDTGEVYLQVRHDADGRIDHDHWFIGESYAGTAIEAEPQRLLLEDIEAEVRTWVHSWSTA